MAKKARKKMEEAPPPFKFPDFDDAGFVWKELEMSSATLLAGLFAVVLGIVSWGLTISGIPWYVPFPIGAFGSIGVLFLIQRLRENSHAYTKGDWAALFVLSFFGWLALWFVLTNLSSAF
jgi:hypothetical protein